MNLPTSPVSPVDRPVLTWPQIYLWYGTAFVLCVIGAVFHDSLFRTDIWNKWAETRAGSALIPIRPVWSDIGRASAGLVFSMFGVAQLQIMAQRRQISGLCLARYELVILSVATTSALFFALYVLPANFFIECTGLVSSGVIKGPVTFTFPDIWKSYVLYLPYVLGLWLGMVFPVFFFFLRSIRHDVRSWKALSENARQVRQRTGQDALDEVWRLWLRRYHVLKDVATHYVPVLTFVAALLV
ncbi:MAG: hypothetical protein QOD51_871, partial [Candidatus Eremiobacteraeota bacterium]|nr:hypothetical protein [Candidatus Eremiobacteraeota bacterium]